MKFITLPIYTKKINQVTETIDWESLGLEEPEEEGEYSWIDIKLNCKILNEELMLIMPQNKTSVMEFVDGSKLQINLPYEELEIRLKDI